MRAAERQLWRRGACVCVSEREEARAPASQRASQRAGAAGRCSPPRLPDPPRPHPAARARGAAPRPDSRLPGRAAAAAPLAARRPPRPALPAGRRPLVLLLRLLPARLAVRPPRPPGRRYFAFRTIGRTRASLRSALVSFCLCPLPPAKRIPLLKQTEPEAPHQSRSPTGCCACAALSCSLFWACVE